MVQCYWIPQKGGFHLQLIICAERCRRQLAKAIPIVRTEATNPPRSVMRLIVSPVERLRGVMGMGDIVTEIGF